MKIFIIFKSDLYNNFIIPRIYSDYTNEVKRSEWNTSEFNNMRSMVRTIFVNAMNETNYPRSGREDRLFLRIFLSTKQRYTF